MKALSLRARLLIATVVLVTAGLLAADIATFTFLRSSLIGRIDEQLMSAGIFATRAMFEEPGIVADPFGPAPAPRGPRETLPVTFGALLDRNGTILVTRAFGFGRVGSPPVLPDDLPGSSGGGRGSRLLTARAEDGSRRYRVLAVSLGRRQGTAIVAFPLDDVDATLRRLLLVEVLVTVAVLGAAAGGALWLVRVGLRPLTAMERAAAEVAAGDLSRRIEPAEDRTEVGRLGLALNAMLAEIEAAFAERRATEERLRRFVADASHELRTPLTSIRGYAELFRHGADAKPDDLAKSMRRIEEESGRMGALVDELLLLARLDDGPALVREAVDLSGLAREAVEDARARDGERQIILEGSEPIVVQGDDARLRQVVSNLVSNALQHTPAETPVRVSVGFSGGEAILEVADEGPGLDEVAASRVFDRFFRADPSRSRAEGGTGLGLAIVAAIVGAHGGRVWVESAPGEGSRFFVALPVSTTHP